MHAAAAMAATSAFGGLLDTRTLGKCPGFDGKPEGWQSWCFKFEGWTELLPDVGTTKIAEALDRAVAARADADLDAQLFGAEADQIARCLYYTLVQLCTGRALAIVRRCPRGNGLLAWRQMKNEYEEQGGHRSVAMLMGLLHPAWGKNISAKQFMDCLDEWENDLDQYERQTSELISDAVKVAVVLKNSPAEVQAALRLQMPTLHDDYAKTRTMLQLLARGMTDYNSRGLASSTGNDMDVDAVYPTYKGKTGGKGDKN